MKLLRKTYNVKPNSIGYLYNKNVFKKVLEPGIYKVYDLFDQTTLYSHASNSQLLSIRNQEVLTKDNIALRFSFNIMYRITDGLKLLKSIELFEHSMGISMATEQRISNVVQILLRNKIGEFESETLNEKRNELTDLKNEEMQKQVAEFGVTIEQVQLKDITFPKSIQDLFAKHLEAKIRSKADIENARTAVATARALKNASELMKDDENIKFFQLLETINKIAEKGKHTFMIGDLQQITKK
jgi:regulator of protease activity HflC (stomatin/prohibitin superfamily)